MPGIFGFIRKHGGTRSVNEELITSMGEIQRHTPGYELTTHADDWFGLGVIGLPVPGGARFAVSSERGVVAAYSGNIYGFQRVAEQLSGRTKDTAARIVEIYSAAPRELTGALNGSFNAAVFDLTRKDAVIWNDRLGHHQLYYFEDEHLFLFAGEYKAFLPYEHFRARLDNEGVLDYFNFKMILGDKTLLHGVKRLRWARKVQFRDGRISIAPWWEYQFPEESRQSTSELIDEAHDLYQQNVKAQCSDYDHVIVPLSGGLDSRMVLAHVREAGFQPHTFCHGQAQSAEVKLAAQVARAAGVEHHRMIEINPLWVVDQAERFVWLTGGMINIGPTVLLGVAGEYHLDATRSVFMNGLAGRTVFGYGYFNAGDISTGISWPDKLKRLRSLLDGRFADEHYYQIFQPRFREALRAAYDPSIESEFTNFQKVSDLFCHQRDLFALDNRFRKKYDQIDVNRYVVHDHWALEDDRTLDFYLRIPPRLKVSTTRTLLVEGLKAKFPHLARVPQQHTGTDLFSAPSRFSAMIHKRKRKALYFAERLTGGLLNLPDYSTYVHYDQWYRTHGKMREYFESLLLDSRTLQRGYFEPKAIQSLLAYQRRGGNAFGVLSHLVSFELFNRLYCDTSK